MAEERLTKNEKRTAAREKAAAMRIEQQRKSKRRKITAWLASGIGVLAIGALITFIIVGNTAMKVDASLTSPNNMGTDGAILTSPTELIQNKGYDLEKNKPLSSADELKDSKVPHIEMYLDYACPHCEEFEADNAVYLKSLLESKRATIEYKPMVVIGANLSFAGGNAVACVANYAPEKFLDLHTQLFTLDAQTGTNSNIRKLVNGLGLEGEAKTKVDACVSSNQFGNWLQTATNNGSSRTDADGSQTVTGTPTVIVDGVKYPYSPGNFKSFMESVLAGETPENIISANG